MGMSKQDFIALADVICLHNKYAEDPDVFTFNQLEVLADFCRGQNIAFKRGRWFAYIDGECGPNGGPIKK